MKKIIPGEEYTIRPRSIVHHMIPLPNPVCNITTYNENGLNIFALTKFNEWVGTFSVLLSGLQLQQFLERSLLNYTEEIIRKSQI